MDFFSGSVPRRLIPFRLGDPSGKDCEISISGNQSQKMRSFTESPVGLIISANSADSPIIAVALPSSGSSEADVTKYADNNVSQAETTQNKFACETSTTTEATTDVLLAEVNDPQPTISGDGLSAPSNAARLRSLFADSDSDVLNLGEITKLQHLDLFSPKPSKIPWQLPESRVLQCYMDLTYLEAKLKIIVLTQQEVIRLVPADIATPY